MTPVGYDGELLSADNPSWRWWVLRYERRFFPLRYLNVHLFVGGCHFHHRSTARPPPEAKGPRSPGPRARGRRLFWAAVSTTRRALARDDTLAYRVMLMRFMNRVDAGDQLARKLEYLRDRDVVVLGLPRGGVPVAYRVARALSCPLDVLGVRKLGVPSQPELAMGAIGEQGVRVLNPDVLRMAHTSPDELADVEGTERRELDRRLGVFRRGREKAALAGRVAVVVDDGIATGSTAQAACEVARAQGAARVVLAVPVAAPPAVASLTAVADEVVCVATPPALFAIGEFYDDFRQTTDDEVVSLLRQAGVDGAESAKNAKEDERVRHGRITGSAEGRGGDDVGMDSDVMVPAGGRQLPGRFNVPPGAPGIVIFAHGSGSSRHSPRNQYVASTLTEAGLGTLLFDLLDEQEQDNRAQVFDIDLLTTRLGDAVTWVGDSSAARGCGIGLFGASTGAAAALRVAALLPSRVSAVVSRGGRPDLASAALPQVSAATLLIVGGLDRTVRFLNETARKRLTCLNRLEIVPEATHLFEEPGTLESVARLARDWFQAYLSPATQVPAAQAPPAPSTDLRP